MPFGLVNQRRLRTFQPCTFATRGSFGLLTPSACPMRSGPGSERMIQAILPGQRSRPDPGGLRLRDSGPEQTARTLRPSAVSRSAYIIGTLPTSSGLGPRAGRPSTAALGASPQRGYVPVQAGVRVQGRRRATSPRVSSHFELQVAQRSRPDPDGLRLRDSGPELTA